MAEKYLTPKELVERWGSKISLKTLTNWRNRRSKFGPSFHYIPVYLLSSIEAYEQQNPELLERQPELLEQPSALSEQIPDGSKRARANSTSEVAPRRVAESYLTQKQLSDRWAGAISIKTLANWRSGDAKGPRGPRYRRFGNRIRYPLSGIEEFERITGWGATSNDDEDGS